MTKEKEFVFPINYKNKEKFLGFIDYKTVAAITLCSIFVFLLIRNISISLIIKIGIFISVVGFFSILMIVGVNGESMLDFLYFVVKFLLSEKVYLYRKTEDRRFLLYEKIY